MIRPSEWLPAAAGAAFRRPLSALALAAAVAAASLAVAAWGLRLDASHGELIADADFYRRYRAFVAEFGDDWEDCLVVIEAGADEEARRRPREFADDLAARLAADRKHLRRVEHRVETAALARAGLHYLEPEALRTLASRLRTSGPALADLAAAPSLDAALIRLATEVRAGLEKGAGEPGEARPLVELVEALGRASRGEPAEPPGPGAWLPAGVAAAAADGYYATGDGSLLLVVADPEEEAGALDPTARSLVAIRGHLAAARAAHPGVRAGLTGRPVLNADEMGTAFRDTTFTTAIAVVLVAGLFAVSCRGIGPGVLVVLVLAAALAWTLGAATLAVGRLNLLSIVFFVVVVGLGVDFPIHLHARDREERAAGTWVGEAVVHAARETGPGLVTAAATTAVAFLAVGLADFRGIRELGLISAMGVVLALASAVLLWPAYVAIVSRHGAAPPPRVRMPGVEALARAALWPRPVLLLAALATAVLAPGLARVSFDGNLLRLQAEGIESVEWERRLLGSGDVSTWFGVVLARSPEEAREKRARLLERRDAVSRVDAAVGFLPARPPEETQAAVAEVVAALPAPGRTPAAALGLAGATADLADAVSALAETLLEAGTPEAAGLAGRADRAGTGLAEAASRLRAGGSRTGRGLSDFGGRWLAGVRDGLARLREMAAAPPPTLDDLPPQVRRRFLSPRGVHLLQVYPREDIWDPAARERYLEALYAVDPEATGVPVQVHEATRRMARGYRDAALWAGAAILALLLLHFRDPVRAVFAITPLLLGAAWTLGLMGWLGIPWNLANLMAIPLLLGIGVDTGVHLLHRGLRGEGAAAVLRTSTGHAVALSAATTALSFGTLVLAGHRGLRSLGLVLALGVTATLLAGMLVLPALLAVRGPRSAGRGT